MCSDKHAPWKNGKNLTLWKFSWTRLQSCQWQIFIVIAIRTLLSEFWIIFVHQSLMIDTTPLDEKYTPLGLCLSTVRHQPLSHLQAPCLVQSFHPVHPIADSHWQVRVRRAVGPIHVLTEIQEACRVTNGGDDERWCFSRWGREWWVFRYSVVLM